MITFERFIFNPIEENTYVVWDRTKEGIIIDAGAYCKAESDRLLSFISENGISIRMIANTHGHFDHTLGTGVMHQSLKVPFALSSLDLGYIEASRSGKGMFGIRCEDVPLPEIDLSRQESISFGSSVLKVIPTPGHTPGGVCFYDEQGKNLFTGDTLFRESIGRTDLEGGDYPALMHSIIERIIPLGDEVHIFPGHGEETSVGHESIYNPFVVEVLNKEVNID